jgi:hypothetical protein
METKVKRKEKRQILAKHTKQGRVYDLNAELLMRCSGTSKPRFVNINTGEFRILGYDKKVSILEQKQKAIFEYLVID